MIGPCLAVVRVWTQELEMACSSGQGCIVLFRGGSQKQGTVMKGLAPFFHYTTAQAKM